MNHPAQAFMVAPDISSPEFDAPNVNLSGLAACLACQPGVVAAYLFGSVARDQANRLSDVDIAVLLESSPEGKAAVERQLALMQALEPFADRELQITLLNCVSPVLAYQVIREGRLLVERDRSARVAFEVHTMKLYFDLQPMLAASHQALIRQIKEVGLGNTRRRDSGALGAAQRIRERLEEPAGR